MRKAIKFTRGSRKVFAMKTRPTVATLKTALMLRGGGYL